MPKPKEIGIGSLDMTLRELLVEMMAKKLDHVVLILPGQPVQISVTVGSPQKTAQITTQVQRIISER